MIPDPVQPNPRSAAPIVFERVYPARPEALWALWTTAEGFASWWGPVGFRADVHLLEGRVGGRLHYDMAADTPETVAAMLALGDTPAHAVRARFAEYEPTRRLVLVSVIDFLPGVPAYDSTIEVDLTDLGEATRMRVSLHPMHTAEVSRMQAEGFRSQLGKLDLRFGVD